MIWRARHEFDSRHLHQKINPSIDGFFYDNYINEQKVRRPFVEILEHLLFVLVELSFNGDQTIKLY